MGHAYLRFSLCLALAACGSKSKPADTTPGGGEGGEAQTQCEPGRCLEDISKLIGERRADSRACYDAGRKRDPKMEGMIVINFAIDSEGSVGETSQGMQEGQIEDPEVVTCVSEVIKTVRFAKSPAGKTTRAYHRFEFAPK